MAYLGNPGHTIAVLEKYNFKFRKSYGQNFLIDNHILNKIVEAADITKDDCVLEIGPGIGTMTQYLCEAAGRVVAVEIDTGSEYDNVTIINDDVLKVDIRSLCDEYNGGRPIKVVANLPYYITTLIVMGLFESHVPLESITVMVQKEVAERMQTGPGSKDYGALSLAVAYYSKAEVVATVSPNCFIPKPNVESSVIHMTLHKENPVDVLDEALLFKLIRATFNQRRKTLVNSLSNARISGVDKENVRKALEAMNKPETIRGETFTLEEYGL